MIYKILSDAKFGCLYPDFKQISLLTQDRKGFLAGKSGKRPFNDSWVELEGIAENGDNAPDISRLSGFHMVLSPNARNVLAPLLEELGEFLPLTLRGEHYHLFNCDHTLDAVDQQRSTLNEFDAIENLKLDENKVQGETLWGIRFGNSRSLFCNTAFKQQVEEAGLSGLTFTTDLEARG